MAALFRWILLICAPFALLLAGTAWIDPYAYFNREGPVPRELRRNDLRRDGASMPFNVMLWKLVEFRRKPVPAVLIGDSRITRFDVDRVAEHGAEAPFHFGVPGGSNTSMFRTFWYADSLAELRTVYLQVAFRNWSSAVAHDIFEEPHWAASSPLYHVANRGVLAQAWHNVRTHWLGADTVYDRLPPDQWEIVMENERTMLAAFDHGAHFDAELERIAAHCRVKGIRLVLLEMPMHDDLHALVDELGLAEEMARYKQRMRGIAEYWDMSGPSALTSGRADYRDPLHPTWALIDRMIDELWEGPLENGVRHMPH